MEAFGVQLKKEPGVPDIATVDKIGKPELKLGQKVRGQIIKSAINQSEWRQDMAIWRGR